jgi:hypothetical protein
VVEDLERTPEGLLISDRHGGPTNTYGKGRSAVRRKGSAVSAYKDLGVSAVSEALG